MKFIFRVTLIFIFVLRISPLDAQQQRIPGTKAFADIPSNLKWDPDKEMYRKDSSIIQFVYLPHDYNTLKKQANMERGSEDIESFEESVINGKNALLVQGIQKSKSETLQIVFLTLDTSPNPFSAIAHIKESQKSLVDSIITMFKNINYKDDYKLDPFELLSYSFNTKITGFACKINIGKKTAFFLKNKPANIDKIEANNIKIHTREKMSKPEALQLINKRTYPDSWKNLITTTKFKKIKKTTAVIKETSYDYLGKKYYSTTALFLGKDQTISLRANAQDNLSEMKSNYRKTIKSFKLK